MPEKNVISWTVMLGGLIQDHRVDEARRLFDMMPVKDVDIARKLFEVMPEKNEVTWTSMLMGYTECGRIEEASDLFDRMPIKSVVACNAMILGFGQNGEIVKARKLHAQILRSRFDSDVYVSSVLITMYIKCGDLVKAKQVFDRFSPKDTVMWNSIITGYAQHGLGEEAFQVFHEIEAVIAEWTLRSVYVLAQ
ncbi:hypothetical protein U1Q18_035664 [Sarracenia purpurea var. burkii]